MPTFMQSLADNPSGKSSVYGQPGGVDINQTLGIVNLLKNREAADFKDKANFMAHLSAQQPRLERLYNPDNTSTNASQQGPPAPINNQAALPIRDPNAMTANQTAEMGLKQQQLTQQGKLGQEAIDVKTAQEKLNQQKSDSIHKQKVNELTAKQTDAKNKLDLATKALADKTKGADEQLKLHQTVMENTKAFHDAELAKKDLLFEKSQKDHQDLMDNMQKKLDAGNKTTTTTLNPDGTSKTVKTQTGGDAKMVRVQGKDGTFGTIPADKLDEWNANHAHPNQPPPALAGPQSGGSDSDEDDSSENGR